MPVKAEACFPAPHFLENPAFAESRHVLFFENSRHPRNLRF
jgi:hypothetical protein